MNEYKIKGCELTQEVFGRLIAEGVDAPKRHKVEPNGPPEQLASGFANHFNIFLMVTRDNPVQPFDAKEQFIEEDRCRSLQIIVSSTSALIAIAQLVKFDERAEFRQALKTEEDKLREHPERSCSKVDLKKQMEGLPGIVEFYDLVSGGNLPVVISERLQWAKDYLNMATQVDDIVAALRKLLPAAVTSRFSPAAGEAGMPATAGAALPPRPAVQPTAQPAPKELSAK